MDAAFLLAAIPDQAAVLGVLLKPFSLGHLILLKRIGSPFLPSEPSERESVQASERDASTLPRSDASTARGPTLNDFLMAVLICSDSYEAGVEQLYELNDSEKTVETYKLWGKKCALADYQAEAKTFVEYLSAAKILDYYTKPKPREVRMGAPFWQVVFVQLLARTNLSESEILNRPLAKSYLDFMTLAELDGGLRFKTEDDIEIERRAKEYYEQLEANKPKAQQEQAEKAENKNSSSPSAISASSCKNLPP